MRQAGGPRPTVPADPQHPQIEKGSTGHSSQGSPVCPLGGLCVTQKSLPLRVVFPGPGTVLGSSQASVWVGGYC